MTKYILLTCTHTHKVLNIQQLLIPVITKEKMKLVESAQQDAINNFMTKSEGKYTTYYQNSWICRNNTFVKCEASETSEL